MGHRVHTPDSKRDLVGPGAYNVTRSPNKKGPSFSFGKMGHPVSSDDVPGPGTYDGYRVNSTVKSKSGFTMYARYAAQPDSANPGERFDSPLVTERCVPLT
jgi:hypothetical protein